MLNVGEVVWGKAVSVRARLERSASTLSKTEFPTLVIGGDSSEGRGYHASKGKLEAAKHG